jgi:heat-inducible transcriptional repressor
MELDQRKQILLQTIVDVYVRRAEPVGSEWLAAHHQNLGVRSATIRNELAEMTEMGYLRQPHTSAGRVPSDQGYRYYVDRLLSWARLSAAEANAIRGIGRLTDGDVEGLLTQTCRVLTTLTHLTSVASPPVQEEPRVRQIHLVQMAETQLLLVVVMESGQLLHRFTTVPQRLKPSEVDALSHVLDDLFRAQPLGQPVAVPDTLPEAPGREPALRALVAALQRALREEDEEFVLEGASHILGQPEFRDVDKVEPIIRLLEQRKSAFETLHSLLVDSRMTVVIGAENPRAEMRECSLVAARYGVGTQMSGWIGLLGPTRMLYERALPAVDMAARALSQALTRLSRA